MKYDAFISYRHSEPDMSVAKKIHKGLETFKVPKAIQKKTGKKNIRRVFRDQEELPTGSDLGDNITAALKESEYLIVICSPRSRESYWVLKEVETFIQLHDREHVLAVLVEGEPEDSFPETILRDDEGNPVEPLAADLRCRSSRKMSKKLKTELLRLAAPILGCSFDDLKQRHRERRMKRMVAGISAVAVLGLLFGMYSSFNAMIIRKNYREKLVNESKYMAEKSAELLEYGDRRAAALVAVEAMPGEEKKRPYVASAELALSKALRCYDTGNRYSMDRILTHELPVKNFSFSADGSLMTSVDCNDGVYVWDVKNGRKLLYITPETDDKGSTEHVCRAVITNEGKLLYVCSKSVALMNTDGSTIWKKQLPEGQKINSCSVDRDGNLAAFEEKDKVLVADMNSGEILRTVNSAGQLNLLPGIVFSEDHLLMAVPQSEYLTGNRNGSIMVCNLQNGATETYKTARAYVEKLCFTEDRQIVAVSLDSDAFYNLTGGNVCTGGEKNERSVEKISLSDGETIWTQHMDVSFLSMDGGHCDLQTASLNDGESPEKTDCICILAEQEVRAVNSETGEAVSSLKFGENAMSLKVPEDGCVQLITDRNGIIHPCNLASGIMYTRGEIDTGRTVSDIQFCGGVMGIQSPSSPDITLMNLKTGYGMETVGSCDFSIAGMSFSEKENYYSVELHTENDGKEIDFYRTGDNQLIAKWTPDMNQKCGRGFFLDDETYVVPGDGGTFGFYSIPGGKDRYLELGTGGTFTYYLTANKKFAVLTDGEQYFAVNLQKRKVISRGCMDSKIEEAAVSEDGTVAVFCQGVDELCRMDMKSGEIRKIPLNGKKIRKNVPGGAEMVFSGDGKYLALNCTDNVLRMIDMETETVAYEIPFFGAFRSFIGFIDGTKHILLQGDDYNIRIYDFQNEEFVYLAQEQHHIIKEMRITEDGTLLNLAVDGGMVGLCMEDYQPVMDIQDIQLFSKEKGKVYCTFGKNLYCFPYMDEEQLYREAGNQFPGDKLTKEERIRFNID